MQRLLSAPGKLFLSGEYAVLWGGTARLAAVGPRASAFVRRRDDREVHLVLEAERLRGLATPLGVRWEREVPEEFRFVATAVDEVLRARRRDGLGFGVAFAPSPRAGNGQKLGTGSSARAAVLATEAARFVLEERSDTLKLALLAHTQAQGGKGSGGDVATCFAGGVVRYRRFDTTGLASVSQPLAVSLRHSPPVDLARLSVAPTFLVYAFTGQSASTPALIQKAEQRMDGPARERFVQTSNTLGQQLEEALVRGAFESLREATRELQALLAGLGAVETTAMERLLALAASYGCAGKVSGAGGGDGVVLFCPDEATRTALLEGYAAREVFALSLAIEPGLRGEVEGGSRLERWLD